MARNKLTHNDHALKASAAESAEAWSQAAKLWHKAAKAARPGEFESDLDFREQRQRYLTLAECCETNARMDETLTEIAKRELRMPTLRARYSDELDFHEVGVQSVHRALWAAYLAGQSAGATPLQPGMRLCIDGQDQDGRWVATELATGQQIRL